MEKHEFHDQDDDLFDDEPLEGYCMRCRVMVEMEDPEPVWTRKGMPATRGVCPVCGGTVFRMGRTEAHRGEQRPAAISIGSDKRKRAKLPQDTVYVNYALADEDLAQQIADDLERVGIAVWLHEQDRAIEDNVNWAGGVHPALTECARMIYVLSPDALRGDSVEAAWKFFREKRKPIVIAQVSASEPPDAIRRSPRFDFASGDYRRTFRQLIQALTS